MITVSYSKFNRVSFLQKLRNSEINEAEKLLKDVQGFYPAEMFINVTDFIEGVYLQNAEVKLIHSYLNLEITYNSYNKKYNIYCRNINELNNLDRCYNAASFKLKEPVTMGKLSIQKIEAWVKFYEEYYKKLFDQNEANKKKILDFKNSIKDLPVKWLDKTRGYIEINGIEFSFTITQYGYIDKQIKISNKHIYSGVETFLKLADNKLFKP